MKITMNYTRFLSIALPVVAIPSLVLLFLSPEISSTYVRVVEPIALLIGAILALQVSFLYRKQLRAAFIFLSAFMFIYMLAVIILPFIQPHVVDHFQITVLSIQIFCYCMLITFCVLLLNVIDIRRLDTVGWIIFSVIFAISIFVVIYPVWSSIRDITHQDLPVILYLFTRVVDAGLVIVLMPVVWLYVQYLRTQNKQSLTFTVIIFGIVWSTIADYIFEVFYQESLQTFMGGNQLGVAVPEMLYLYGYLIIAVGLYAHLKQDEWGYDIIDKAMGGELSAGGSG